jgi:hypothetical protein
MMYQKKPKGIHKFFTDEQRPEAIAELLSDMKLSPLVAKYNISYQTLKNLRQAVRLSHGEAREPNIAHG